MIEDTEVKIAVNKDEAFWENARKRCEDTINNSEKEIMINKHILILCAEKLKEYSK